MGTTTTQPAERGKAERSAWITHLYSELHAMARRCFRNERASHTLQPTALVHEALMRLARYTRPHQVAPTDQGTLALAAVIMRRVLVDHARHRRTRRGSEHEKDLLIPMPQESSGASHATISVLVFDEMLERLARADARASRVIELRFFGGLTIAEAAQLLGLSMSAVESDSRFALAWMRRDMAPVG